MARSREKRRTVKAPAIPIRKKLEIDRIIEEAEAHLPESTKAEIRRNYEKPRNPIPTLSQKPSELMSFVNKEALLHSILASLLGGLTALKVVVGEDSRIIKAQCNINDCVKDWGMDTD